MPDEPLKQYQAAGLPHENAEKVVALKAPMEAKGLNWSKLISLLVKLGPVLGPTVIDVLTELTKPDGAPTT